MSDNDLIANIFSQTSSGIYISNGDTIQQFRLQLQTHHKTALTDANWLIGTEDCHLCEEVKKLYQLAQRTTSLADLYQIDVLELDQFLMAILAPKIPILITKNALLIYPFGLLDIVNLGNINK